MKFKTDGMAGIPNAKPRHFEHTMGENSCITEMSGKGMTGG
jgi:hypothetical protein